MGEDKTEKVIAAAGQVFLRYGFRRTTMGDIAEAARMSRPAVYLVFPSKEEVFTAVLKKEFGRMLGEIRSGIGRFSSPATRLTFAFELWCVQPFALILASPDARDLLESGYEFSNETVTQAFTDFTGIVSDVLTPLVKSQSRVKLSATRIASVIISSAVGFKQSARTADDLRKMLDAQITLVLAGLQ